MAVLLVLRDLVLHVGVVDGDEAGSAFPDQRAPGS
jgi:hypothetical protein